MKSKSPLKQSAVVPPPLPPPRRVPCDEIENEKTTANLLAFDVDDCITSTKCGLSQLVGNESQLEESQHDIKSQVNELLSRSEKFKMTSTLIRQQTRMLIKKGYYQTSNQLQAINENSAERSNELFKNELCSFCLINTVQDSDSSAIHNSMAMCRCHQSSTATVAHPQASSTSPPHHNNYSFTTDSTESSFDSSSLVQQGQQAADEDMSHLYVCIYEYEAKSPIELNLKYSDRVRVVQFNQDSYYILVQMIKTSQYGFVPKHCLTPLTRFMSI